VIGHIRRGALKGVVVLCYVALCCVVCCVGCCWLVGWCVCVCVRARARVCVYLCVYVHRNHTLKGGGGDVTVSFPFEPHTSTVPI